MKHDFARQLRHARTDVERKLWFALRGRRFHRFKFRRRQPTDSYIVDFVCFETRPVVELDGGQHGGKGHQAYDADRTRHLKANGFRVLRFANHEVNPNFESVLDGIALAIGLPIWAGARPSSPWYRSRQRAR
ncbi:MAG: DUF559 domain-containing protein [Alphaproteobacteria bacterium]|nr:DUF559 domain-containing protein [Alphaproteobacteria bacterium]